MYEKIRRIAKEQGWSTAQSMLMAELKEDDFDAQLDQSPTASWMILATELACLRMRQGEMSAVYTQLQSESSKNN